MDNTNNNMCMICESKTDLELLNSKTNNKKNCLQMYQYCFNLNFPKENQYGNFNMMCSECVHRLKECVKFRRQSDFAHQRLCNYLIKCNYEIPVLQSQDVATEVTPEDDFTVKMTDIKIEPMFSDDEDLIEDCDIDELYVKNERNPGKKKKSKNKMQTNLKNKIKTKKQKKLKKNLSNEIWSSNCHFIKMVDIVQKRSQNTVTIVQKVNNVTDDDEEWSDWSTNTEEILIATGFYNQREVKPKKQAVRPQLKKGTLKCPTCGEEFINYHLTCTHYITHYPVALCHLCGKTTPSNYGMKLHMRTHETKTNDYICKQCNKVFKTQSYLNAHVKITHRGEKSKTCYHCPMKFSGSKPRAIHMHKEHGVLCQLFECNQCDRKFYSKYSLKYHSDCVHAKKISYFCDKCSGSFVRKSQLRDHISFKHGDGYSQMPVCETCGKSFKTALSLKKHLTLHTMKPAVCSSCGREFKNEDCVKLHLKRNHCKPVNPADLVGHHSCKVCGKLLKYKRSMSKHMKIHLKKEKDETAT